MLGLFLASSLIPGVQITGAGSFILAALLLGLVNVFVRPIAYLLSVLRERSLRGTSARAGTTRSSSSDGITNRYLVRK